MNNPDEGLRHRLRAILLIGLLALGDPFACNRWKTPPPSFATADLVREWDQHHLSPPLPPLMRHAEVESGLQKMRDRAPHLFQLEEVGRSVEGRSLNHIWFGRGTVHVLLWSQMHGDEPTATAALFDLFDFVYRRQQDEAVRRILDTLTIHVVPMLNPDGAERFQRRNAQGIDINRDALLLQTPEGRALKVVRDRVKPSVGFNLHNQNWRTSAGETGRPASISLLAVAYDEQRSENEGRRLTKRLCSVIREALEPLASGRIARYDDQFEVRAFGDNLTKWGTSVVLIETGPWPAAEPDPPLVRLNFIALITSLDALATGRVWDADPRRYESLPLNDSNLLYLLIKNATIVTGTAVAPFVGDIGIVASRAVREVDAVPRLVLLSRIEDLGDLRVYGALETIDATGLTVTPAFRDDVEVGSRVRLPKWQARKEQPVIAVNQPVTLFLLKPSDRAGDYVIERIVESERILASGAKAAAR